MPSILPGCFEFFLQYYTPGRQYPMQKDKFLRGIETVTQIHSVKKVFLDISQNSLGNTCARVSILIKLQGWDPEAWNFIKKETLAQMFSCEICKISKNAFFSEPLRWLLLRAPNFVSVLLLCTIQNTSDSFAKAHL